MIKKPNFLIIGAQKGGSTWLYDIFKTHSEVFLPEKVELLHFSKKDCNAPDRIKEYLKNFDNIKDTISVIGEKTPSYLWTYSDSREYCKPGGTHNKNIPESVAKQLGLDTKLISSLRHPVMRAISSFFHHVERARIEPGKSIMHYYDSMGIVDMGFYSEHLKKWMSIFDKKSFLTLIMERDIINNPDIGYEKICNFLDVLPEKIVKDKKNKASNEVMKKRWEYGKIFTDLDNSPFVTGDEIQFLVNLYQDDMNKLRELLDDPLTEWKKIDQELLNFAKTYKNNNFENQIQSIGKDLEELSFHQLLLELGVDLSVPSSRNISKLAKLEVPVKLSNTQVFHNTKIGAFSYLIDGYVYNTDIGRYCSVARNVNIGQGNHPVDWLSTNPFQYEINFKIRTGELYPYHKEYKEFNIPRKNRQRVLNNIRKPKTIIGNDVWIGHGVIINSGVNISDGAIIGAGSVVTKDIPPYAIAVGVPARIIKYRFSEEIINKLLKIKWWQYAPWSISDIDFNDIDKALKTISKRKLTGEILPYSIKEILISDVFDLKESMDDSRNRTHE